MTESKKHSKFKSWIISGILWKSPKQTFLNQLKKAWPFQWPGKNQKRGKLGIAILWLCGLALIVAITAHGNRRDGREYTFGNSLVLQAKVTKREYIATHIMAQMMAVRATPDLQWSAKILAEQSVVAADWLIFELNKPEKKGPKWTN